MNPSPTPVSAILGDVRAADAPGLAGGPLEILLLIVVLGIATVVATVTIARVIDMRTG